jgi:hypothetical protein
VSGARKLWGMPILLGLVSIFALAAGLLGDGVWDWIAALSLAVPLLAGAWHALKRPAH